MHASPRKGRDLSAIIGSGAKGPADKELNGNGQVNGSTGKMDLSVYYGESEQSCYGYGLIDRK